MALELGSSLIDYVWQLSFPCISYFPGHGSYACPVKFKRSPLGIQYPKLVFTLRQFQEGRRITGPFRWACAQSQRGPGPRACMGLGSRPIWALGSWCRTGSYQFLLEMRFNLHVFCILSKIQSNPKGFI